MGFLQDLGSFMGEVNALSEELDSVKHDIVTSIVQSATEVKETVEGTVSEISDSASQIQDTVKQSTTLPSQPLADDTAKND